MKKYKISAQYNTVFSLTLEDCINPGKSHSISSKSTDFLSLKSQVEILT